MATSGRFRIRRKWKFAAENLTTAQNHLLDARVYYVDNHPEHLELVDACIAMLEQGKLFLIEARNKV